MRQLDETLNLLAEQDPSIDTADLIMRLERRLATEGAPVVAVGTSDDHQPKTTTPADFLRLRSRRTWALAAGFVAAALIIGLPLWLAGGTDPRVGDQDVVSTPLEAPDVPGSDRGVLGQPTEVFELATDSLCDWFTADDLNEIVAGAQARVGTDFEFEPFDPAGCWKLASVGSAWGSAAWPEGTDIPGAVMVGLSERRESVSWDREFERHEMLDPSISYIVVRYTVAYDAGLQVELQVDGRDQPPLLFLFGVGDPGAQFTPKYEDLGLAIANELLRRMNWISGQNGGSG